MPRESTAQPSTALAPLRVEQAGAILAECKRVDECRSIRDKAEAIRMYLRKQKASREAQNDAAEIKLLAERRLGQLLAEQRAKGERAALGERKQMSQRATSAPTLPDLGITRSASARWQEEARIPVKRFEAYIAAQREKGEDGAEKGEVTSAGLRRAAAAARTSPLTSSESVEWYTPTEYVEAARQVLGAIDLDPASCETANAVVKATRFYSRADDGLAHSWRGRVWLNPPYGGAQAAFAARLLAEHAAGNVPAAVLLINGNAFETSWFRPLWDHLLCFVFGRIDFRSGHDAGQKSSSTHGSVLVYLGPDRASFAEQFAPFGAVVARIAS